MLISPRRVLKPTHLSIEAYLYTLNDSGGLVLPDLLSPKVNDIPKPSEHCVCGQYGSLKHNIQALTFRLLLDNLHQPT